MEYKETQKTKNVLEKQRMGKEKKYSERKKIGNWRDGSVLGPDNLNSTSHSHSGESKQNPKNCLLAST